MSSLSHQGEIAKISGPRRAAAMACYFDLAKMAVQAQGISTLLLPSATVTAVHEAGHAIMHAAVDHPPFVVSIWPVSASLGGGYSGECDFEPGAPSISIHAYTQPHKAIERACVTLAGWIAEMIFAIDRFKYGSSLDEITVAGGLIRGAAESLEIEPEKLWKSVFRVTGIILQWESTMVTTLQKRLVAENRIRGRKLSEMLGKVARYAVVDSIIAAATESRAYPDQREYAPDEVF